MMRASGYALSIALLACSAACSTKVDSTNPFDPGTPSSQQARSKVIGVIDPAVLPGGGETVSLFGTTGPSVTVVAGTSGTFEFDQVAPDTYYIEVRVNGFQPLQRPNIVVAPGATVDVGTLTPSALGTANGQLGGRLHFDNDQPAAGATARVSLVKGTAQVFVLDAPADATGAWAAIVLPGTYVVTGMHPLYLSSISAPKTVTAGAPTDAGLLVLPLNPASLSGVVLAETAQAGGGTSNQPATNATVTFDEGESSVAGADGSFTVFPVSGQQHVYRVQLPGWHDPVPQRQVKLTPGKPFSLTDPIVLALDRGAISGVLQTADAQPIEGAAVQLSGTTFQAQVLPDAPGAARGVFLLSGVPVGVYSLGAQKAGYHPLLLSGAVTVKVSGTAATGTFDLQPDPAVIKGAVLGEAPAGGAAQPLQSATVSADGTALTAQTAADGTFTLPGIPAGSVVLRVHAAGFSDQTLPVLSLGGGEVRTLGAPLTLALTRGALFGKVQVVGAADASGVTVSVTAAGAAQPAQITDAGGAYTFSGLVTSAVAGGYTVTAAKAGWLPQTAQVTVTSGAAVVPLLTLQQNPAVVKGTVLGELAAGGSAALASVTVSADGTALVAQTAADGTFTLAGLSPGNPVLRFHAAGYADQTQPVLALGGGETRTLGGPITLALARGALSGQVQLSGNGDASGVVVTLSGGTAPPQLTDASGGFAFGNLVIGVYTASAAKAGYLGGSSSAVLIAQGATAKAGTITLQQNPGTLQGHVVGENTSGGQDPLQGAAVTLDGVSSLQALTSATGDFNLTGVPTGSYLLRVHLAGYADQTLAVLGLSGGETRVVASAANPIALDLARGSVSGTVTLPDSADASGIVVELTGTTFTAGTSKSGAFRLDGVLTLGSPYQATARKDGYLRQTLGGPISVVASGVTPLGSFQLVKQGGGVGLPPFTNSRSVTLQLNASNADGYAASEDPSFTDGAKGDVLAASGGSAPHGYTTAAPFTLGTDNGQHAVYVIFFSGVSRAPPAVAQTVLDTVSPANPSVQINTGAGYARSGISTLTLHADELPPPALPGAVVSGVAQVQVANLSAPCVPGVVPAALAASPPVAYSQTLTWSLAAPLSDGNKYVCVRFFDAAGNSSAVATASVVLDQQAPQGPAITLTGPGATPGYTNSLIASAGLSATDANAGAGGVNLLVRLANTPGMVGAVFQPFQAQLTWVLTPGDGVKTVYAEFADPAGNVSARVSASITLATVPPGSPTITLVENDTRQNGYTNDGAGLKVKLSAAGAPVTALVSEDPSFSSSTSFDLRLAALPATFAWPISGDGLHTVYARFIDAAGNASAQVAAPVTLLTTKPLALAPALLPSSVVKAGSITLVPPSAGQAEVRIAGAVASVPPAGVYQPAPAGVPIAVSLSAGDGVKALDVTWRDLADNTTSLVSAGVPVTVTLDTAAPAALAFTVSGKQADGTTASGAAGAVAQAAVTLDLSHQTDATSGITQMKLSNRADLADAAWTPFVGSVAVPWTLSAGDGLKTVYALFQDAAGNSTPPGAPVSGSINLATTPPSATALTIEGGAVATGKGAGASIALALSATGAFQMALSQDNFQSGTTWGAFSNSASTTFSGTDRQTRSVQARFRNAAGIEGPPAQASIFWSHTAPSAAGWALSIVGALGDGLGASGTFTNAAAVAAQLVPPAAGVGFVTQVAFAQPPSASCAGAFGATPTFQPYQAAVPVTLTAGDGLKYLCATFRDAAGNADTTSAVQALITLDTTQPTAVAFKLHGAHLDGTVDDALTATAQVTVDFAAESDATAGLAFMKVANDPTALAALPWQPFARTLPWTLAAGDGAKTVSALFRDAAGNVTGAAVQATTTLDTSPPASPQVAVTGGAYSKSLTLALVLAADGTDVRAQVSENPTLATGVSTYVKAGGAYGGASFTLGGSGARTLYARFTDAAGNQSALATAAVTVILPAQGPLPLAFGLSPAGFTKTAAITVTPPAAATGQSITVSGDLTSTYGPVAAPAGVPIALTLSAAEGLKVVSVTYTDPAGNSAAAPSQNVLLDQSVPAAVAFTVSGVQADGTAVGGSGAFVSSTGVTLDLSKQRDVPAVNGSGLSLMKLSNLADLSDASWQAFNPSAALPWTLAPGDGLKTVYALFQDFAGNQTAATVSGSLRLAAAAPTNGALVLAGGAAATKSATNPVTVSATGAAQFTLSQDNFATAPAWQAYPPGTTPTVTFTGTDQQTRTVWVKFRNAARVESSVSSASVFWDQTPPSATGWALALQGTLGSTFAPSNQFTQSTAVTAQLTPPAAGVGLVTQVALAPAVAGSCAGAFASPVFVPYAPGLPVTLVGSDGAQTYCALLGDAAGNSSAAALQASITLDTHAPLPGAIVIRGTWVGGASDTTTTAAAAVTLDLSATVDPAPASGLLQLRLSNTFVFTGAFQPYQPQVSWTLPAGDGNKTVSAQFLDAAGNLSGTATGSITLDTTPPGSPLLSVAAYAKTQIAVPITLSADVTAATAVVSENPALGGGQAYSAPFTGATFNFAGSGARTLYARFYDAVGNPSVQVSASTTIILPAQGPVAAPFTLTPATGYTQVGSIKLTPGLAAANQSVTITGDLIAPFGPALAPPGVAIPLTLTSTAGVKNLSVVYSDPAGNTSAPVPATLFLDSTAPAPVAFTIAGVLADGTAASGALASVSSNAVTLNLFAEKSTDGASGSGLSLMKLSNLSDLSDASWQAYNASVAFPWTLTPGDGVKTVYALFQDFAGNQSAAAVSGSIKLAATAPANDSVVITSGVTATSASPVGVTLTSTGALQMALSTDNFATAPSWVAYAATASVPLVDPDEQQKTITARFRNAALVEGPRAQATIFYDHTAPGAGALALQGTLAGGAVSTSLSSTATVTALITPPTNPASTMALAQATTCATAFAAPVWQPLAASAPIALTGSDGNQQVCVIFRDAALNFSVAASASASIKIDRAGPVTAAFSVTGSLGSGASSTTLTATPAATLDLSGQSDATSGIVEMKLSNLSDVSDAVWVPFNKTVSWTLAAPDGSRSVYAQLRDAAGNASGIQASSPITLDTAAPTAGAIAIVEQDSRPSNGYTNNPVVKLNVSATGAVSAVVSENPTLAGGATLALPVNLSALPTFALAGSGARTIYVRFYDAAFNPSALQSASVVYLPAAQGPLAVAPVLSPTPFAGSTSITLTPPSAGQTELQIAGALAVSPYPSAGTFAAAPAGQPIALALSGGDGLKTLNVTWRDLADNTTAAPPVATTLDTTAPLAVAFALAGTLADQSASASFTATANVTLDFSGQTDAGAGLASMKLANSAVGLTTALWQPFFASVPWALSAGDGPKTVYAIFRDAVGNANANGSAVTGAITLAAGAPTQGAVVINGGAVSTSNATLSLATSAVGATQMAVSTDNFASGTTWVAYATGTAIGVTDPDETLKTVSIKFRNAALVPSATAQASILYDHTAPGAGALSLRGTLADGVTTSATLTATLPVTALITAPPGNATQMALAQSATCATAFGSPSWVAIAPSAPFLLAGPDGAISLCVLFRDAAGNFDATKAASASIVYDHTAPSGLGFGISGILGDGTTSTSLTDTTNVTLNFAGESDATSGITQGKLANTPGGLAAASWQAFSSLMPWTLAPGDGTKTVYALFRDAAGNATVAPATGTITLAATPPSGSTLVIANGSLSTAAATVPLAVTCVGATQVAVSTDNFASAPGWVAFSSPAALFATLPEPDSTYRTVSLRFRNAALLEGASISGSIFYDHTAPAAPTVTLRGTLADGKPSSALTATPAIIATITAPVGVEVISGMAIVQTGGGCGSLGTLTFQPFVGSSTVVLNAGDGSRTVCVVLQDGAGNFNAANYGSAAITLDTTPPSNPTILSPASGYSNLQTAVVTINAAVDPPPVSSSVAYECIGGAAFTDWTSCGNSTSISFPLTAYAENILSVRAFDQAANRSSVSTIHLTTLPFGPAPPAITSVKPTASSISLNWSASANAVEYLVNYALGPTSKSGVGALQGPSPVSAGAATNLQLSGLPPATSFWVSVIAVDAAGNSSAASTPVQVRTQTVTPRVLSVYGSAFSTVGVSASTTAPKGYLVQGQGVVQLDLSSDAATTVTGRATLPGMIPSSLPTSVLSCTHAPPGTASALAGDCVFVTSKNGVSVVYFDTTTGNPMTIGLPVSSIDFANINGGPLSIAVSNHFLYVLTARLLEVFDVTDPSQPQRVIRQPLVGQYQLDTGFGMGVVGNTLYCFFSSSMFPGGLQLLGLDVTNPRLGGALPVVAFGSVATQGVNQAGYATTVAAAFNASGAYLLYTYGGAEYLGFYGKPAGTPGSLFAETSSIQLDTTTWSAPSVTATASRLYAFGGTTAFSVPANVSSKTAIPSGSFADEVAAYVKGGVDHLVALRSNTLSRWTSAGGSALAAATAYTEHAPEMLFEWDDYVVCVRSATSTYETLDLGNPLAPALVQSGALQSASYLTGTQRGRLLFLAPVTGSGGVEIYRINNDGSLTFLHLAGATLAPNAVAVAGNYLFVGQGTSATGLAIFNISNPSLPVVVTLTGSVSENVTAVAVRHHSIFVTDRAGNLHLYSFTPGSPVPTSAAATITTVTTAAPPVSMLVNPTYADYAQWLTVKGDIAVVSSPSMAFVARLTPTTAVFDSPLFPVGGPLRLEGGYVVGNAAYVPSLTVTGSNDGLSFALLSQDGREGTIDGTLAGIGCRTAAGYQTLTQRRGLYLKACGLANQSATAGLQVLAVADAQGGSLLQSYAGNWQTSTPNNRPFATDGMYGYLGANNLGSGGTLSEWTHSAEGLASGVLSLPTFDLSVTPAQPRFQSLKDGVLHAMVDWASGTPYVFNFDASNPAATLGTYFGYFTLPSTSSAYTVPPVTDGEYLYLAFNPGDAVTKSGIAFVHLPDGTVSGQPYTQPAAFTLGALANLYTGLALYRGYLYAAWYNGAGSTISVFDVTTPSTPVVKPAITGMSPGSPTLANYLYDLTISGGSLLATGAFLAPPAPAVFLFWAQLGATRDGTSPRYSNIEFFIYPGGGGSIGSPTLIGDTMYLRWNSGLAAFDLRPWWRTQALYGNLSGTTYPLVPAYVTTQGDSSTAYKSNLAPLVIDGPWAYLLSQDFRVFDLR